MGFQKGHKKVGGVKKGQKQKRTIQWEEFGRDLLESGLPRAKKIMATAKDEKFMEYFKDLLEYFKPKLARAEVQVEGDLNVTSVTRTGFKIKTNKS